MSEAAPLRLRGYIGSRPYFGDRAPQHVQNLVVRDYCNRNGAQYLLSVTEYIMGGCYMMLEESLRELPNIDGIAMYSVFMLPRNAERRARIYDQVLSAGKSLHGAVENFAVRSFDDVPVLEDMWRTKLIVDSTAGTTSSAASGRLGEGA